MFKFADHYLSLIIIVAIIAVLVSQRSATVQVIQAMSSAMGNILGSIVQPITAGNQKGK